MAHQDGMSRFCGRMKLEEGLIFLVVPVNPETWAQWTHPPFSGHMDKDGWVWGRGSTDMKGTVSPAVAAIGVWVG